MLDHIAKVLRKEKIKFERNYQENVDFFLPQHKIVLLYYQCYWHACQVCYPHKLLFETRNKSKKIYASDIRKEDEKIQKELNMYNVFIIHDHDNETWLDNLKKYIEEINSYKKVIHREKVTITYETKTFVPSPIDTIIRKCVESQDTIKEFLDHFAIKYIVKTIDKYDIDIILTEYNIVILFSGCFSHRCEICGYSENNKNIAKLISLYEKQRRNIYENIDKKQIIEIKEHEMRSSTDWIKNIASQIKMKSIKN